MSKRSIESYHDFIAKVILIGDSGVGKTNLLTRFSQDDYKENYVATIGVDFKLKSVSVEGHSVKLQIWDTAGQERFKNITKTYYRGAAGIVLAYSIASVDSFNNVTNWLKQLENTVGNDCCKILVGTKVDLEYMREVPTVDGKALATSNNMLFIQTSAKTGQNVQSLFLELTRAMRNKRAGVQNDSEPDDFSKRISTVTFKRFSKKCC